MKKNPAIMLPSFAAIAIATLALTPSNLRSQELLAVDFGTAASPVEPGFVGQSGVSATHSTAAGNITVAISGQQGTFDYAPPSTSGSNTALYRDFFFKNGSNAATGTMTLTLSGPGIRASTDYVLGFWTQYQLQTRPTVFTPSAGAAGPTLGPLSVSNAAATGLTDPNHFISGTFTSNASGVLTISITATNFRPAINGIRIAEPSVAITADPQITSFVAVGGGVWEIRLKGAASTAFEFRSSTTLEFTPGNLVQNLTQANPGADPGVISGPNSEIVTTDGKGEATVRLTLTGTPADFVRAQTIP